MIAGFYLFDNFFCIYGVVLRSASLLHLLIKNDLISAHKLSRACNCDVMQFMQDNEYVDINIIPICYLIWVNLLTLILLTYVDI